MMSLANDSFYDLAQRVADSFPEIDNDISTDLFQKNSEYAALRNQADEMQRANPCIMEVLEGDKEVSLSAGEHRVLTQYLSLSSRIEDMELLHIYFRGHADSFAYLKRVGVI